MGSLCCGDDRVNKVHVAHAGLFACCCPCVTLAQVSSRLDVFGGYTVVLWGSLVAVVGAMVSTATSIRTQSILSGASKLWFSNANTLQVLSLCCSVVLVVLVTLLRGQVRQRRGMTTNTFRDYVCAACCPCCCLAEMAIMVGTPETYKKCPFGSCEILPAYDPK
ncbi:hypothetical protein H257_02459 [Aphanomyces astaci]|uniref:PLAC8 family protein n=1 Tax=Aphanomyces astaci TaxID=112090 RepID=W4H2V8_APHAT|nr:hypothetical protein H257_02459 [Aphanomyces astaci]ETV85946.1 hypothetical protein H257_02459 [Aphanomyces astaci]|eukprot:XP_009824418.1 hypothetical protein H257_02459 [Aphanomyces astaci]